MGQPTWQTHPHLMAENEVTPYITREEYESRRHRLVQDLPDHSVVVVPGYLLRYRANGIFYPFAQNGAMYYLCGFKEPLGALVLVKDSSLAKRHKSYLFMLPKDKGKEMWDGYRTGHEYGSTVFNVDGSFAIEQLHAQLAHLIKKALAARASVVSDFPVLGFNESRTTVEDATTVQDAFMTTQSSPTQDLSVPSFIRKGLFATRKLAAQYFEPFEINSLEKSFSLRVSLQDRLDRLRVYKSDAELKLMRKAGAISGRAITQAMRFSADALTSGKALTEQMLEATIEYHAKMEGAEAMGYVPVVAGGKNGLILHYTSNDRLFNAKNTVIVDAGATFGGYTADITRTWPLSRKFSYPFRLLYEAVLLVQKEAIQLCRESSKCSLNDIHEFAMRRLWQEVELAMGVKLSASDINGFFPHHIGHYLGIDVHDTPTVSRNERLRKGMVVTIEPGIYIPETESRVPPEFRGLSVRIEDDVYVDSTTPIVLSTEAPKEVVDIENL